MQFIETLIASGAIFYMGTEIIKEIATGLGVNMEISLEKEFQLYKM